MKTYEIEVIRKDSTIVRLQAWNIADAYRLAADDQGVPNVPNSFGYIAVIPTAKQITKTKSLLRGI